MRELTLHMLVGVLALSVSACALTRDRNPIPPDLKETALIAGIERARFFSDAPPPDWAERTAQSREALKAGCHATAGFR